MKKVVFIMILALLGIANFTFSQEVVLTYNEDSGLDTAYIAGSVVAIAPTSTFTYDGAKFYSGVAGFVFNVTNYVDTLTVLIFEGGFEGPSGAISYVPIDTLTELIDSRTYSFYQAPPAYQKYRMRAPLVSGDTATVNNIIYFEKVPKLKR